jgi:hypothetical protein
VSLSTPFQQEQANPGAVAVAIEVPHGPVVDTLLDRGFAVHAINPKQLDRLRDRFSIAGAKDDRRDARIAAAGLRTDPCLYRQVEMGDSVVIELREWSRLAEELQQERVRLSNRVRQQLWRYYPQLLALAEDVAAEWVLALWSMAPTPAKAARLRQTTMARLLKQHHIRKIDAVTALGILRQPAITVAPGVTEAAVQPPRLSRAQDLVRGCAFHKAQRQIPYCCHALCHSLAAAQRRLPLGAICRPDRPQEPHPLCRFASEGPLLWTSPARRCRPAAWGRLYIPEASDHLRSHSQHAALRGSRRDSASAPIRRLTNGRKSKVTRLSFLSDLPDP